MTDKLRVISYDELQIRFHECLTQFHEHMQGKEYTVTVSKEKSSFWMAQMALPQLDKWGLLPSDSCIHAHDIFTGTNWRGVPEENDDIVLFDDCSYSGDQLCNMITKLNDAMSVYERTANFTVVVPFLSVRAKSRLESLAGLSHHLHLTVITSQDELNNNCGDLFTDEEIDYAMVHDLVLEKRYHNFKPLSLVATDWKIPDNNSLPDWCKHYLTPSTVASPYKTAEVASLK